METLTPQQVYERSRDWFTKPGAVYGYEPGGTLRDKGTCVYRGNGDATSKVRCSVGIHIPDDMYSLDMENQSADTLIWGRWGVDDEIIELEHLQDTYTAKFLEDMQQAHDNCANEERPMSHFIMELDQIAKNFQLQMVVS